MQQGVLKGDLAFELLLKHQNMIRTPPQLLLPFLPLFPSVSLSDSAPP